MRIALLLALGLALAACGGNNTPTPTNKDITTTISNTFDPATVTIKPGDSVTFINGGGTHNVTFQTVPSGVNTADINVPNDFKTPTKRVLNVAGQYDYICTNHTGMAGSITVAP